jgi:hypothetical protein
MASFLQTVIEQIKKLETDRDSTQAEIAKLTDDKARIERELDLKKVMLNTFSEALHKTKLKELYLTEINRLAALHFVRLRKTTPTTVVDPGLTGDDYRELEKWIARAKSTEGLKNIVDALTELNKYYPKDIKSNLYALVQRIIIEGPFGTGQKASKKS